MPEKSPIEILVPPQHQRGEHLGAAEIEKKTSQTPAAAVDKAAEPKPLEHALDIPSVKAVAVEAPAAVEAVQTQAETKIDTGTLEQVLNAQMDLADFENLVRGSGPQ